MKYDVVIVGAGPAGMAAAHILKNNNISCCVIDKQVFPRNKLCAGGVTGKAMELLRELNLGKEFNGSKTIISSTASLYVEYDHIIDIDTDSKTYLVDRFEFDEYLVSTYKNKGGAIIEGIKVNNINTKQKKIMLSDNNIIDFEYIIGADGSVGITRSLVNKNFRCNGFSLQVDIEKSKIDYKGNNMSLYYGVIPYGYGWIFPKADYLTIGIGSDYNKSIDFKKEFTIFLSNLGVECSKEEFKGAFLPFGDYIKNPINEEKNVILVGDAAGFADPITGEGIYFAILSGMKAGQIITEALENSNRQMINNYIDEIKPITNSIYKGAKLKKSMYKHRKIVFAPFKNEKIAYRLFNKYLYNSDYNINISKIFFD